MYFPLAESVQPTLAKDMGLKDQRGEREGLRSKTGPSKTKSNLLFSDERQVRSPTSPPGNLGG